MINVTQHALNNLLMQASFSSNGDKYEQQFGNLVVSRFPNCELFWKLFVVPLTERITGYPNGFTNSIRPRQGVDEELENIANTNYTVFLNLIYAHLHLKSDMLSDLENFYAHLGSVCDLVETFIEKWFFLLIKCRGEVCETLQKLSHDDFILIAGEWYENAYSDLYEHYLSKGKPIPIKVPSRKNVIKEFFIKYMNNDKLRKRYINFSQSIRQFRNVVIHDVQVGKLTDSSGTTYIPRPRAISNYKTWRQIFSVAADIEIIKRDFRPKKQQMESDLSELEAILNEIWELIINEFVSEFYSNDRRALRDMYLLLI